MKLLWEYLRVLWKSVGAGWRVALSLIVGGVGLYRGLAEWLSWPTPSPMGIGLLLGVPIIAVCFVALLRRAVIQDRAARPALDLGLAFDMERRAVGAGMSLTPLVAILTNGSNATIDDVRVTLLSLEAPEGISFVYPDTRLAFSGSGEREGSIHGHDRETLAIGQVTQAPNAGQAGPVSLLLTLPNREEIGFDVGSTFRLTVSARGITRFVKRIRVLRDTLGGVYFADVEDLD